MMYYMTVALYEAIAEFKRAHANLPLNMESGWIDDFQRRRDSYVKAVNKLLEEAAK